MYDLKKSFISRIELLWVKSEDAVHLVGEIQLVIDDIPFPTAQMGNALGFGKHGRALGHFLFKMILIL